MNKSMQLLTRAKKQREILGIGDMATLEYGTCNGWPRKNRLMTDFSASRETSFCESCVEGKHYRRRFPVDGGKRSEPLGLVQSDVCGKINAKSLSGGEYFLTFIDDNTRYIWIYVLKHKDEVFRFFLEYKAQGERSTGRKLKPLHTDNGGEYVSADFEKCLKEEGVRHELTVPKTPEQNGVAERMNRTLVHAGCC